MNNYTSIVEAIKERVSMQDVIALYAPNPAPRHNRIPCPIHAGKDRNLWFSDWGYHCFVCGSGGDIIHFVQNVFGISFPAAIDKINTDFSLGLPISRRPTLREKRDAEKRHKEIAKEREQKESEKKEYEALYWKLWDEYIRLDKNRVKYAPRNPGDELHPLFVEALHKIEYQKHLIETLLYSRRESTVKF